MAQVSQLLVIRIVVPFQDRNPIFDLKPERMGQIVDDQDVLQVLVADQPQVLDEEAVLRLHAVVSRHHPCDVILVRIQVLDYGVSVGLR